MHTSKRYFDDVKKQNAHLIQLQNESCQRYSWGAKKKKQISTHLNFAILKIRFGSRPTKLNKNMVQTRRSFIKKCLVYHCFNGKFQKMSKVLIGIDQTLTNQVLQCFMVNKWNYQTFFFWTFEELRFYREKEIKPIVYVECGFMNKSNGINFQVVQQ
jgi:hypothetical protein